VDPFKFCRESIDNQAFSRGCCKERIADKESDSSRCRVMKVQLVTSKHWLIKAMSTRKDYPFHNLTDRSNRNMHQVTCSGAIRLFDFRKENSGAQIWF